MRAAGNEAMAAGRPVLSRLAKRYHSDQGNQNSHELMAIINIAKATILKNKPCSRRGTGRCTSHDGPEPPTHADEKR